MTAHNSPRFQNTPAIALAMTALFALPSLSQAADPAPASAAAGAPTLKDPCGGSSRCFNAGTFTAEVIQVSPTAMTAGVRHHVVNFNIRFRNATNRPLILAYQSGSSSAHDNFGNAFTFGRPGTHDTSVKGIGMVAGRSADTQFALAPGQSRNASFGIIRFNARPPIGEAWNYDVVIEEIEIQPGQVVRSVRQNSVSFSNLRAGGFASAGGISGAEAGAQANAVDVASKVIDLFGRSKNNKQ